MREFQAILERSSPEEALLFQRYYMDGQSNVQALAEELGMSVATIYRHLGQVRKRFFACRGTLKPSREAG